MTTRCGVCHELDGKHTVSCKYYSTDDDRIETDLRAILVRRGYTPRDLELGGVDYAMLVELVLYVEAAIKESRIENKVTK